MYIFKLVILTILFIQTIRAQSFVQISANPNVVQSRNAEITISFALSKALAVDDTIRLIFPPDTITVSQDLTNCVETDNRLQFKICRAEVQNNTIYLKLGTAIKLEGTSTASYSIKIQKAINLPTSNATVQDIKLFTRQNETRFTTYQAKIGILQSTTLTPGTQIVGADTSLQLQFTTSHITPKKGKIHLKVQAPWNDGAITTKIDYFGSISCNSFSIGGISVLVGTYTCLFLDKNRVEISGGFPDAPQPSGVQIQITITGFKNPIRANYDFQVFEVYTTGDDINNFIDYTRASIKVTDAAELITPAFQVSSIQDVNIGIVQELNIMEIKFGTPVPLVQNCTVSYWFPSNFYDAEQIIQIRTGSLLTRIRTNYNPSQDLNNPQNTEFVVASEEENKFKSITFKACPEFSNQDVSETTRIEGLRQPLSIQPTDSVRIYIRDGAGQLTAFINKSLSFVPEPGQLSLISASISPQTVSSQSFVNVQIQPQHSLKNLLLPSITIKMPNDFKVQNDNCSFQTDQDNLNPSAICESSVIENTLTIYNFLSKNLQGEQQISFQIGPVKLPETIAGGKGQLNIGTYLTEITDNPNYEFSILSKGMRYQVDFGIGTPDFQILEGTFLEVGVEVAEKQAFLQTDYTFTIKPEHIIPQYGIIMVEYPPQVSIQDPSLSQALCAGWQNFPSVTAVCQIFTNNRTIIITKGFHAGDGIQEDEQDLQNLNKKSYSWTIPFFTNPPNLLETKSFTFRTFDKNFNLIDQILSGATIKMNDPSKFKSEMLTLGSYLNAEVTSYQFSIVIEIPVRNGYAGVIKFPPENQLAIGAISCSSPTSDYINQISCQQSQTDQKVIILQFYLSKQIPALETFVIIVNGIQNPLSTKSSQLISFNIFSDISLGNLIAIDNGSLFAKTYIPYPISESRFSLSQSVQGAGLPSNITINAQVVHELQPSSGILIRYPPQLVVDESKGLIATINAQDFGYPELIINPEIDYSAKQILFQDLKFTNGLQVTSSVQKLIIEIQGFSNPYNNEKSQSFQIVTFNTEENVFYLVDQVSSGLTINSICNFPCKDCATGKPSQCLSCFMDTSFAFLEDGTCLEKCSDGYFFDQTSLSCKRCNSNCLTCLENSGNCLTCGGNQFPLLRNNQCVSNCGDGFIDDPSNNICLSCRNGCSTCSKSVLNCTSCDPKSPTPLYFNFDCIDKCPINVSVQDKQTSGQPEKCIPCSPLCNTCEGKPDLCTSCVDYKRLDPLNNRCLDACLQSSQIYNKDSGKCDTCSVNCESCSGSVDRCTKCKPGFVLTHDSTCESQCTGLRSQIIIDQKCTECKDPCNTCDGKPDVCTSCFDDLLLYKSTCVDHCPDKYEPNNATINQCILRGLICTEGFHINEDGEGCIPDEFQCDNGYVINERKTACIPAPGQPIPFPFLFFAFCMSLVVAGSHLKERSITKVYSSLIMLLSSTELLQAILIAIKAVSLEQPDIAALGFIATATGIIGNLIFVFCYKKYIYQDSCYYDWIRLQIPLRIVLPFLMAIINFKIIRLVFSGLFNLSYCQAQFSKPMENVHKWIKIFTILNFLAFQIPLLIANLLILGKIGWGQQLLVLGIETLILQIIITLLTIKELLNPHTLYPINSNNKYELLTEKKANKIQIKNTIDDYENIDEKKIIRQDKGRQRIEIDLRRTALAQILKQIDPYFLNIDEKNKEIYLQIETVNRQQELNNTLNQQSEIFEINRGGLRKVSSCHNFPTNQKRQKAKKKFKGTSTREEGSSGSVLGKSALTQEDYDSEDALSNQSNNFEIEIDNLITKKDPKYLILGTLPCRRNSFPFLNENIRKEKENKHFFQEVEKLRKAIEDEKYRDNCYYEVKPELPPPQIDPETGQPKEIHVRKKKLVNRRTQTYLRELLWLEGEEKLDSDLEIIMEDDIDLSDGFVGNLINGVIDGLSLSSGTKTANLLSRRSRPGKKKKEQPKFELQDILGDFDLDNEGSYIIIQEDNDLQDKKGRLVNQKGYLIDKTGNVITANGQVAFKVNELDADGEIPATFVFTKNNLLIPQNIPEKQTIVHDQDDINYLEQLHQQELALLSQEEDEIIAKEMSEFKQVIKAVEQSISDFRPASQVLQKKNQSKQTVHYEESDNIEQMLDLITKKHIPVRSTDFFSSKVEPNSKKKQKPSEKKQLRLETSPEISRQNDKKTSHSQLQVRNQGKVQRGQSEDGISKSIKSHDKKNLQRIADMLIGMADQVADHTSFGKQVRSDAGNMSLSKMQAHPQKPPKFSGKDSDISGQKFGLNTVNQVQFVSIFGQNKNEDFTKNQLIGKPSPDRSRVYSGNPKLRDLENIYLPKEQKVADRQKMGYESNQDKQAALLADNIQRIEQELKMHTFDDARITASWNKDQINQQSFENYTQQDVNTERVNHLQPKI